MDYNYIIQSLLNGAGVFQFIAILILIFMSKHFSDKQDKRFTKLEIALAQLELRIDRIEKCINRQNDGEIVGFAMNPDIINLKERIK